MKKKLMNYKILAPQNIKESEFWDSKLKNPFDLEVVALIEEFSQMLFEHPKARQFPELTALAYWFRKANIKRLQEVFFNNPNLLLARGTAFHIAPGNVDTIFIYSCFLSMLVGNRNIVRISSEQSEITDVLVDVLNQLPKLQQLQNFLVVRYEHNEEISSFFSKRCDLRIIWGGDQTIAKIRSLTLKPTAIELTFADKFSFCILNANAVKNVGEPKRLLEGFFNDAFTYQQMACSSPRLVVWLGKAEEIEEVREEFWKKIEQVIAKKKWHIEAGVITDKLTICHSLALENKASLQSFSNNYLNRVLFEHIENIDFNKHNGGGLFYEYCCSDLAEINSLINEKIQTVSIFGIEKSHLRDWLTQNPRVGIDRIVPVGQALEFCAIWDGFDLLQQFCRCITLA